MTIRRREQNCLCFEVFDRPKEGEQLLPSCVTSPRQGAVQRGSCGTSSLGTFLLLPDTFLPQNCRAIFHVKLWVGSIAFLLYNTQCRLQKLGWPPLDWCFRVFGPGSLMASWHKSHKSAWCWFSLWVRTVWLGSIGLVGYFISGVCWCAGLKHS